MADNSPVACGATWRDCGAGVRSNRKGGEAVAPYPPLVLKPGQVEFILHRAFRSRWLVLIAPRTYTDTCKNCQAVIPVRDVINIDAEHNRCPKCGEVISSAVVRALISPFGPTRVTHR